MVQGSYVNSLTAITMIMNEELGTVASRLWDTVNEEATTLVATATFTKDKYLVLVMTRLGQRSCHLDQEESAQTLGIASVITWYLDRGTRPHSEICKSFFINQLYIHKKGSLEVRHFAEFWILKAVKYLSGSKTYVIKIF